MIRLPFLFLSLAALLFAASSPSNGREAPPISDPLSAQVYFSPGGGAAEAVIAELGRARRSVLVLAFSFTSAPIAEALVKAHRRGVKVEVVLDDSNRTGKYSAADFTARAGIPTFLDSRHAIMHSKVMVIDGIFVITGSFNFTKAAEERNAENLLVIKDKALASRYAENWNEHKGHSEAYAGR
jgi:phosphatidylserine/phosphatidylglycerophosphate/cardiolipin synthase-like enzyme